MNNKVLTNGAFVLLTCLWAGGCAEKATPEPAAVLPTTSISKSASSLALNKPKSTGAFSQTQTASSLGADYDAGYKVGMDDAVNLYNQMSFTAACPDNHADDEQPKLAGDQTDFGGGSGSGTCRYWRDPVNGQDQYHAQIFSEKQSGMQHENAAATNAEADYYHGYVQGLNDGSLGK